MVFLSVLEIPKWIKCKPEPAQARPRPAQSQPKLSQARPKADQARHQIWPVGHKLQKVVNSALRSNFSDDFLKAIIFKKFAKPSQATSRATPSQPKANPRQTQPNPKPAQSNPAQPKANPKQTQAKGLGFGNLGFEILGLALGLI